MMMKAEDAIVLYGMSPHEENGHFVERHYTHDGSGRPASGSIYYYLGADEVSEFHTIDCDEYWTFAAGEPVDIWSISPSGELEIKRLGIGAGLEPMAFVRAGTTFGARHRSGADDGTLIVCITVPRFTYAGWRLVPREEVASLCPSALEMYED